MGGIHQSPEKELPNDLKAYLESSKHGVIYLSFGTNALSGMIPHDKVQTIIKVLSNLPYDVLWKWDKDELPGKSNNIKISKWFPQSDLLRHSKVKLFITQAGLQSTDEAITAGVPLIAIPMLADQWYNAEKYVKHGIGKQLNLETLTEYILKDAVETVINDESYRENIIKLRQLMRDQPETPLERAVWWAEYVIRHGGAKHLRAATANLSYAQYFEVDLILIVFSVSLIILAAFVLAIVRAINFVNNLRGTTKIKFKII
ncbi:UDP-glycosyltransferase UGT5-like isoform X2 [Maniola hyperantus]